MFVLVVALAALGAFTPKLLLSDAAPSSLRAISSVSEHPVAPAGCASSSCNRGGPAPVSLSGKSALEWAVLLGVLAYMTLRIRKRFPLRTTPLPRGESAVLFHPPQSLSFS